MLLLVTHLSAIAGFAVAAAERGDPVRIDASTLSLVVREGTARALLWLLSPTGLGQSPPRPARSEAAPRETPRLPVLLVAGQRHNRASLLFLATFLTHRGWQWVWRVNVATPGATLAEMAVELGRRVDELKRVTGAPQIDIVGVSIGGLAAAWYVRHLDGQDQVRRLVTVGTPWHGTKTAVFRKEPMLSELRYGNPVLQALAPPRVPTLSVWSTHDTLIVPADSAVPEGAEAVQLEGLGHTEMLLSARAYRAVQAALQHRPTTLREVGT